MGAGRSWFAGRVSAFLVVRRRLLWRVSWRPVGLAGGAAGFPGRSPAFAVSRCFACAAGEIPGVGGVSGPRPRRVAASVEAVWGALVRDAVNPSMGAFRRHPRRRIPADGPPHHLLETLPARRPRARHATFRDRRPRLSWLRSRRALAAPATAGATTRHEGGGPKRRAGGPERAGVR